MTKIEIANDAIKLAEAEGCTPKITAQQELKPSWDDCGREEKCEWVQEVRTGHIALKAINAKLEVEVERLKAESKANYRLLKREIEKCKEDLRATKGGIDSGSLGCRLSNSLRGLISFLEHFEET